ncbi:MAG: DUF5696 domain-containing protein [Bacillota bacterium]|nr:DUF5696 domain-containing protein [Bacillota bacterium]
MKRSLIIILVILVFGVSSIQANALQDYEQVAQNEYLELYINPETAEIAVYDLATKEIWYSNPPNRDREEKVARGKSKERLGAQIILTYFTQVGAEITMDNYNDSVIYNQLDVTPIEQGVRVDFTLGEEWGQDSFVPNVMTEKRFEEEVLARVTDPKQRELLLNLYPKIWFEEVPDGYAPVKVTQVNKEKLFPNMTLMAAPELLEKRNGKRELYDALFDHIVGVEKVSRRSEITPQVIKPFLDTPLYILGGRVSRWDRVEIADLMREIGFIPTDRTEDLEYFGYSLDGILPNHIVFTVSVEYVLDGQDLVARVPLDSVSHPIEAINPSDPESPPVTLPVYSIRLLPYFGAANEEEDGYMLVPDGPGALIHFNNGKVDSSSVTLTLYGRDNAINRDEQMRDLVPARLPIYGMSYGDRGLFAIIEKGDAVARVRADIAGRVTSYNIANAEFIIRPKGSAYLQTTDLLTQEVVIAIPQSRSVAGDLQIRYSFLSEEKSDYVGMAHHYQRYLQEKGMQPLGVVEDSIPFYLDLVGSIQVKRPILGVPQTLTRTLTTYKEVESIIKELENAGVTNVKLRYGGWLKGGLEHDFPSRLKWEKAVGGKRGFKELRKFLDDRDIQFFPDVTFMTARKNSLFDGVFPTRDAGRFLDRTLAKSYKFDRATYQMVANDYRYILSAPRLSKVMKGFFSDFEKLELNTISLNDLAYELNSDFRYNPNKLTDREQAKNLVIDEFKKLQEYELMLNGGFAYGLPFAKHVVDAPDDFNGYPMIDEMVPFYQIAVRGFINYAGEPLNFAYNPVEKQLRSIETGAFPYYVWGYSPSSQTKHTAYNDLYSLYYGDWFDDAVQFYHDSNSLLKLVQGRRIVGHEQVQDKLYKTAYENGVYTLVNYNDRDCYYQGITVPARGYRIMEGGVSGAETTAD